MEGTIMDVSGAAYRLPTLLSWEICHGFCSPCDSFETVFLYQPEMRGALQAACRFSATDGGKTVFRGVVDELEVTADADGCTCVLRGRGMQALLLDSEAESAEYTGADMAYILERHVRALGVTAIDTAGVPDGVRADLSVESGESHWSVVKRFAEFCLGVTPRFAPDGTLVLSGGDSGRRVSIGAGTAISEQGYWQDRYGVISEAIVKNRVSGTSVTVENAAFQALGGRCVRVINVPRTSGFDAMRHTGAYQIAQSALDFRRCRIAVDAQFAAFPGDRAVLVSTPLGITGTFTVSASRCYAGAGGAGTVLELREG